MIRTALLVSHGQPSDPVPAEDDLAALACKVAAHLPDWRIGSATLAAPGSLASATMGLGQKGVVYPLFMAGGWFTRSHLPAKLAEAGAPGWQVLEPMGCDPAIHDLAVELVRRASAGRVLLAAHGSHRSPVPSDIAHQVAERIERQTGITTRAAFIDQDPQLSGATGFGTDGVCLPFFAAKGGHVTDDIPAALTAAGFAGRLLPALGLAPEIPGLIARAILAGTPVCAVKCRWQRGPG